MNFEALEHVYEQQVLQIMEFQEFICSEYMNVRLPPVRPVSTSLFPVPVSANFSFPKSYDSSPPL